jgi:hypothetical protein
VIHGGTVCLFLALLLLGPVDAAFATPHAPVPAVQALQKAGQIEIDGHLDEPAWHAAAPAADFRQLQPAEGAPATERTELRILFDDDALYIGARLSDSSPRQVVRRRSRLRPTPMVSPSSWTRTTITSPLWSCTSARPACSAMCTSTTM